MKLKKLWPLFGAMCVSLFSSANAAYQTNGSNSSTYGSTMDSSSQTGQSTYQRGTFRDITPAAGPRVAHGADVFLTADFIWWKAVQEGLTYAVTGVASPSSVPLTPTTGIPGQGTVHEPSFGWDPGFKVGLGLNLSHDGWDLYAQYTWLHSSATNKATGIGITNEIPALDILTSGNVTRSCNWDLHFNVIDLELGRNFYVSQFLTLRPHFGLKGTWQEQDFRIKTVADSFTNFIGTNPGPVIAHQNHNTWGLGVRAGLNTAWHFTTSWSIFGDIAWAAMWTHYDVDAKNKVTTNTDSGAVYEFVNTELNNYRIRYVAELELGLRWETWFYDDNYHFAIQAGWEEQIWINYGNFIRLFSDTQSDLSLYGLNLKFRFDF